MQQACWLASLPKPKPNPPQPTHPPPPPPHHPKHAADYTKEFGDVYWVTMTQLIEWMQNPGGLVAGAGARAACFIRAGTGLVGQ